MTGSWSLARAASVWMVFAGGTRRQLLAVWCVLRRMLTVHDLRDRASHCASSSEDVVDLLCVLAKDVAPALQEVYQRRKQSDASCAACLPRHVRRQQSR
jgi:hypothetical protein